MINAFFDCKVPPVHFCATLVSISKSIPTKLSHDQIEKDPTTLFSLFAFRKCHNYCIYDLFATLFQFCQSKILRKGRNSCRYDLFETLFLQVGQSGKDVTNTISPNRSFILFTIIHNDCHLFRAVHTKNEDKKIKNCWNGIVFSLSCKIDFLQIRAFRVRPTTYILPNTYTLSTLSNSF